MSVYNLIKSYDGKYPPRIKHSCGTCVELIKLLLDPYYHPNNVQNFYTVGWICPVCELTEILGVKGRVEDFFGRPRALSRVGVLYLKGKKIGYVYLDKTVFPVIFESYYRRVEGELRRRYSLDVLSMRTLFDWLEKGRADMVEVVKDLDLNVLDLIRGCGFYSCPFCDYSTHIFEDLGSHILRNHPREWRELKLYNVFTGSAISCPMVSRRYTMLDLKFEMKERPKIDPESIFSDENFVKWFLKPIKKKN